MCILNKSYKMFKCYISISHSESVRWLVGVWAVLHWHPAPTLGHQHFIRHLTFPFSGVISWKLVIFRVFYLLCAKIELIFMF